MLYVYGPSLVGAESAAAIEGLAAIRIEPGPEDGEYIEILPLRFSEGISECTQIDAE
jgi:hypothetical protein